MFTPKIHDIIAIGIGPFNLGLAALLEDLPHLSSIFFDQSEEFNWHPGMLLPNAKLQVPFYADLLTVVNPCSRFTFLNYLKETQRLFRFAIHENNFVTRKEYNAYCKWVIEQLTNLHFNHKVIDVHYQKNEEIFTVIVHNQASDSIIYYQCKHLIIGIGAAPSFPECARGLNHTGLIHSQQYLFKKNELLQHSDITIVGSGQSAAEIFYDLLDYSDQLNSLNWFTRSERFYPMEYSKLSLEMTSPDYIDHFYALNNNMKQQVLKNQHMLYRGINYSLINDIYDALYQKQLDASCRSINIHNNTDLIAVSEKESQLQLKFYHTELHESFEMQTGALILATGYMHTIPGFLEPIKKYIQWMDNGLYNVNRNYSIDTTGKKIFVQNAELHTHGFSAPDLGMGPYRNATILNTILGYEHFLMEKKIAFQTFALP